jgi:hypothetical protein
MANKMVVLDDTNVRLTTTIGKAPCLVSFGYSKGAANQTTQLPATIESSDNGVGFRLTSNATITALSSQFSVGATDGVNTQLSAVLYKNGLTTNQNVTVTYNSVGNFGNSFGISPVSCSAGDTINIKFFQSRTGTTTSNHVFMVQMLIDVVV